MDPLTFALALRSRGIDLHVRRNRLGVWPPKSFKLLTDAEREFLREHRDDLKELVRTGLPETPARAESQSAPTTTPPRRRCPYCYRTRCDPEHEAYRTLHWNDPAEVARRTAEATEVLMRNARHGHWSLRAYE